MAWTATENFDSYTPGTDVNGLSGGSGWNGNWTRVTGDAADTTVETAPAGGQGGVALRMRNTTSANGDLVSRLITAVSAGAVSWRMRTNTAAPNDDLYVRLGDDGGGNGLMYIKFNSTGQIMIFNNGVGYENIQAFSVDTWYTIDVEFDDAAQPDQYRARVDGGSWTGWKTVNGGTYTTVDRFSVRNGTSATPDADLWVDDIKPTPAESGATLMGAICM